MSEQKNQEIKLGKKDLQKITEKIEKFALTADGILFIKAKMLRIKSLRKDLKKILPKNFVKPN